MDGGEERDNVKADNTQAAGTVADSRLRPVLFAIMPYGRRRHPDTGLEIDFDQTFEQIIEPAARETGCNAIRSDRESTGGLVHTSMFERLLLADIVIADISIPNANVFYELGIRHATRPRTTITIGTSNSPIPFDIAPLRHIFYTTNHALPHNPADVRDMLCKRITTGLSSHDQIDSPIFQTVVGYPGIQLSHESSESYRDRVIAVIHLRKDLQQAVADNDNDRLDTIETACLGVAELVPDVVIAYRDIGNFDKMIATIETHGHFAKSPAGVELSAFALGRRNLPGDRARALALIEGAERSAGHTSERSSLKGRILKDMWLEQRGTAFGEELLLDAIGAYAEGVEADPRDPLPGVNLLVLLAAAGQKERISTVAPVVAFAIARQGGMKARDHFDLMSLTIVETVLGNHPTAMRACHRALMAPHAPWMRQSAIRTLELLPDEYGARHIINIIRDTAAQATATGHS